METNNSSLLPYVLDILSRQTDLCTTIDAICEKMHNMIPEDVIIPLGGLRCAVEFAVNLGVNLGLLTLSDQRIRLPFNFRGKYNKTQTRAVKRKAKRVNKNMRLLAKSIRRRLPVFKHKKKYSLRPRHAV